MMRRKPLLFSACTLIVAATVTADIPFAAPRMELVRGYSVSLVESTVLIGSAGHPSTVIPLNWIGYGLAFIILLYCFVKTFEKEPRGFDVDTK